MTSMAKKKPLTAAQTEEARVLKNLWLSYKDRHSYCTQTWLAEKFGITQGAIYQYLAGVIPLNLEIALKFAKEFGVQVKDFSPSIHEEHLSNRSGGVIDVSPFSGSTEDGKTTTKKQVRPMRVVPIVGRAKGGDMGHFDQEEYPVGYGDGVIYWPTNDANAYSLRIVGDSMSPRIRHGEFVIVEPNSAAEPGDDVIARFLDGRRMCKRLIMSRKDSYEFGSINNSEPSINALAEEVETIHKVVGVITASSVFYKPE